MKNSKKFFLALAGIVLFLGAVFSLSACSSSEKTGSSSAVSTSKKAESSSSSSEISSSSEKSETSSEISPFLLNKYGISVKVIEDYFDSLKYKKYGGSESFSALSSPDGYKSIEMSKENGEDYDIFLNGVDTDNNRCTIYLHHIVGGDGTYPKTSLKDFSEVYGVDISKGDWLLFFESVYSDGSYSGDYSILTNMEQLNLAPCP